MTVFLDGKVELHAGDCREVIAGLADASIDAVVTDPPYALVSIAKRFGADGAAPAKPGVYARGAAGFMGKKWDTGEAAFAAEFWAQVYRVLKPGGHVLAFGGTRTYHRLACAIEDAGFEIRDQIGWAYGSGFPKSQNVAKFIDKAKGEIGSRGAPRSAAHAALLAKGEARRGEKHEGWDRPWMDDPDAVAAAQSTYIPGSPQAQKWDGWGTALKPAWEPIVMARKPLIGTVAENVLEHGTGALNIDGCRVEGSDGYVENRVTQGGKAGGGFDVGSGDGTRNTEFAPSSLGRWPANIIHDGSDEVIAAFPESDGQQGDVRGTEPSGPFSGHVYGEMTGRHEAAARGDTGSAARFFKAAKLTDNELLLWRAKANIFEWNPELANTVDGSTVLSKEAVASALSDAVIWASRGTLKSFPVHFTSATPSELRRISEAVTATILSSGGRLSRGLLLDGLSPNASRVSAAAHPEQIGTMTITISHWKSDGSAEAVIFDCTATSSERGVRDCARLFYSSKADADDRLGSKHPTVKPLDLMQYLVRLVTPPGGTVLDPFAGTGTTGEAAWREGMRAVLIERETEYQADIARRMDLAENPAKRAAVAASKNKLQGAEGTPLFGDVA